MAEEYDNKNSGALYPAENMEIIRQGKIDVEGNDVYMLIVKMKDKNGNDHYKFYQDKAKICYNLLINSLKSSIAFSDVLWSKLTAGILSKYE